MVSLPEEIGRFTFTEAEILRFARDFDPQPFHVDAEAAKHSPFGALVASGWHVVCVWMGFFVRTRNADAALPPDDARVIAPVGVGFGLEGLAWKAPVRVGDTLLFRTEVLEARPSAHRPGWTVYRRRNSAQREDGTEVMSFELNHMVPDAAAAAAS